MALKFGPQWLRDLTDDGTGTVQPHTPSYGVKFKLADYRYGREEMLALYSDTYSPPDQVRKHQVIFSKENQRPISMTPLSEDEQRLMSQGINSHVVLRGGRGGGVADRGRGRGRGRGDGGYVPRQQNENGEQPFTRQPSNDGWEVVGRKPERSFSRGFEEQVPPAKREFLRSSSNNWRDKKLEAAEEEESSSNAVAAAAAAVGGGGGGGVVGAGTGPGTPGAGPGGPGVWRQNRENNRWGSSRPNWRQPTGGEYDESRQYKSKDPDAPRGPRRTSDSYDNEVPEWAIDDIGDDHGTFDSKGIFVSARKGPRENHSHDTQRTYNEGQSTRKRHENIDEVEHNDRDKPRSMNEKTKVIPKAREEYLNDVPHSKAPQKSEPVNKPAVLDFLSHSMKGDGDSLHSGLMYSEKNTNGPQAPHGPSGGMAERMYHAPTQPVPENIHNRPSAVPNDMDRTGGGGSPMASAESENLLRMEKSLQNLLAGMTANADTKAEEEVDVSKGALPLTHKDANKWFYRDPQGKIQGPFSSESMAEWFRIGYFTMNLIVKRGCDDSFKELGELIKQYGRVPFVPGPPLPPLITSTSASNEVPIIPEIPATPPMVMTMPSMVNPMMPGMMGPTMPSLHDRFMFRSMMLQQEYLKQQLMMQQLQMQTMAKLQEQENFKDYTPDQQHDIAMRMMMQTNPLLIQQMQQLQHQQVLLQQQQQQLQQPDLHQGTIGLDGVAGPPEPFQHPMSSIPSMHTMSTAVATPIPSATVHNPNPVSEQEAGVPVWANNPQQHTENSIWSQPSAMWNMDNINMNDKSQAYKMHIENIKREREEEKMREEERIKQELMESKQEELRKQQNELQRQKEQVKREKEELDKERMRRKHEQDRIAQVENVKQKKEQMEHQMRVQEEKKKHDDEKKKRDQETKKQEEKRRKEEEKLKEQKRKEEARKAKESEDMRRQQEKEAAEARQREEMQKQMELQQIQEEEERIKRENAEKEKQQAFKKQQLENQRHQESLRKLQQAQKEQLANMQLPAASNWAKHASQGSVGHSKSLTEIQEEEARREKERQKEQHAMKQRMQEQAAILQQQQQTQNQKSWASQVSRGMSNRGPSLLDIQQQEKENAKKAEKERGKAQNHQAKSGLGSGSARPTSAAGLWGTNSTWESSVMTPSPVAAPVSTGGIWDMGVPQSVKKPQQGKNGLAASSIPGLQHHQQQQQQQQQSKKKAVETNKKAAVPAKQKQVESVQKLFHNKKQDGFSSWVTDKLSRFSSVIDIPTFVSFIVEVDSPHDVLDYVKTYLGDTKETQDFSRQFLEKRNQCKNQMRLQKQLEEDSIWGPAPAINPHTAPTTTTTTTTTGTSSDLSKAGNKEGGGGIGQVSKSKNKKKKKGAAQKMDASILGFTVTADPNRRNASGEFETID